MIKAFIKCELAVGWSFIGSMGWEKTWEFYRVHWGIALNTECDLILNSPQWNLHMVRNIARKYYSIFTSRISTGHYNANENNLTVFK